MPNDDPLPIYDDLVGKAREAGTTVPGEQPTTPTPVPSPTPRRTFTQDDGSTYTRIPAREFPSGDDIDSTTVHDDGAPN